MEIYKNSRGPSLVICPSTDITNCNKMYYLSEEAAKLNYTISIEKKGTSYSVLFITRTSPSQRKSQQNARRVLYEDTDSGLYKAQFRGRWLPMSSFSLLSPGFRFTVIFQGRSLISLFTAKHVFCFWFVQWCVLSPRMLSLCEGTKSASYFQK